MKPVELAVLCAFAVVAVIVGGAAYLIGGQGAVRSSLAFVGIAGLCGYLAWKILERLLPRSVWQLRVTLLVLGAMAYVVFAAFQSVRERQEREIMKAVQRSIEIENRQILEQSKRSQ